MVNVVFVCLGNICRSPMAEGVFQQMVFDANLTNRMTVDSAGTSNWHVGERAHRGTQNVLQRNNIPYDGRGRQFERSDFNRFDYILAMDRSNFNDILRLAPRTQEFVSKNCVRVPDGPEITLFLSYAYEAGSVDVLEVPDPYYTGGFDEVYDLVRAGSAALLDHIRTEHNL